MLAVDQPLLFEVPQQGEGLDRPRVRLGHRREPRVPVACPHNIPRTFPQPLQPRG